jgi:hypothetical protein
MRVPSFLSENPNKIYFIFLAALWGALFFAPYFNDTAKKVLSIVGELSEVRINESKLASDLEQEVVVDL